MRSVVAAAIVLVFAQPAAAQDDCIENIVGRTVCGADADAVRARIRAEQAVKDGTTEEYRAQASKSSFRSGSVYSGFRNQAFVRGGYVFAGREAGFSSSVSRPSVSAGFRFPVWHSGRSNFGFETEILYTRDSEDLSALVGAPLEIRAWGIAGLLGYRWDYATRVGINPFASVGVGPGYLRAKLDDGITIIADGDWTFAYSGRAGVTIDITEAISLETAYRYLGSTQTGTPGQHSGELGLNFGF